MASCLPPLAGSCVVNVSTSCWDWGAGLPTSSALQNLTAACSSSHTGVCAVNLTSACWNGAASDVALVSSRGGVVTPLLYALGEAMTIILLGYYLKKFSLVPDGVETGFSTLAGRLGLPCIFLAAIAKVDLLTIDVGIMAGLIGSKWLAFIAATIIGFTAAKQDEKLELAAKLSIGASFSNDVALGLPVVQALYGEGSTQVHILLVYAALSAVVVNPLFIGLLEMMKQERDVASGDHGGVPGDIVVKASFCATVCNVMKGVVLNPLVGMVIIGLVLNVVFHSVGVTMPPFADNILKVIGNGYAVSALLLTGMSMGSSDGATKHDPVDDSDGGTNNDDDDDDDADDDDDGNSGVMGAAAICVVLKILFVPVFAYLIAKTFSGACAAGSEWPNGAGVDCGSTFAYIVGSNPASASLTAIIRPYGVNPRFGAAAVVASSVLFAPLDIVMTVLLTTPQKAISEAVGLVAEAASWGSLVACAFTLLGAVGSGQYKSSTFPRNTIFHLAMAQGLYAFFRVLCDLGVVCDVTYMISYFFRVQSICYVVIKVYVTLCAPARIAWRWLLALAWVIPVVTSVGTYLLLERQENSLRHGCWMQYGMGQLSFDLGIHVLKFLLLVAFLNTSFRRRHLQKVALRITHTIAAMRSTGHGMSEELLQEQDKLAAVEDLLSNSARQELNSNRNRTSTSNDPEPTLRTEVLAVLFVFNALYHITLELDVLRGACGSTSRMGTSVATSTCSMFATQLMLFGSVVEDGQGMWTWLLFGTTPDMNRGITSLFNCGDHLEEQAQEGDTIDNQWRLSGRRVLASSFASFGHHAYGTSRSLKKKTRGMASIERLAVESRRLGPIVESSGSIYD